MKKKIFQQVAFIIGLAFVLAACSDEEDADQGREAAARFCDCFKQNTKEKCLDELKDRYQSYVYKSNAFIEAFNDASTCNIKLELIME
jgi:hypothetical protein